MPGRVRVVTQGCKVNQYDGEALLGLLQRQGWRVVRSGPAELVIVNTCTVTARADADARRWIRRLRRDNPSAILVVTGCLPERDHASVDSLPEVDFTVPNSRKADLPRLLREWTGSGASDALGRDSPGRARNRNLFGGPILGPETGRARAFLKVQEGCRQRCSYCIVPSVRGPMRSRSIVEVIAEIRRLVDAGYAEVVLCGVHLGAFGRERDEHLADLVRGIDGLDGKFRVRLSSLEPWSVDAALLRAIGESRRMVPHLHLPLQSGSDMILERMRRPYTAEAYAGVVEAARREIPGVTLGTDVMVGFPGEGEAEFEESLAFLERHTIDLAHVFTYSPRESTSAASWPAPPQRAAKERLHRVRELFAGRRRRWLQRHVNRVVDLVTLSATGGETRALSGTYAPVRLEGRLQRGRLVPGRVLAVEDHGLVAAVLMGADADYNADDDSALERNAVEGPYVGS